MGIEAAKSSRGSHRPSDVFFFFGFFFSLPVPIMSTSLRRIASKTAFVARSNDVVYSRRISANAMLVGKK
jgi:hypothetical protein